MDVHPVILAGGHGSGMYPLLEGCPKALLPVGNFPLIYYPIRSLERNGFKEVTVIVNSCDVKPISLALNELRTMKFSLHEIHDASEEIGSANALCALKGKIKSDLLVMSCDVIMTTLLHNLWDLHISQRSTITMLLHKPPSLSVEDAKKQSSITTEQDLIGITDQGQMVFHSSLADVDDELKLSKKMLQRTPYFKMHTNLLDTHVYIVSRWVLDYIDEHFNTQLSLKRELLPHLIRRQGVKTVETEKLHELAVSSQDPIEQLALKFSSFPAGTTPPTHPIQCHALTISEDLCMRVNTVALYMEANRVVPQHFLAFQLERAESPSLGPSVKNSAVSGDSLIGDGAQISDRASVKRSMIGRHCVIAEKVKIINSVIMDHVVIGEGCIIQNTVVCNNVRIEEKVTLKDCTVGTRVIITSKTEHKGELLVEESELDII